MTCTSCGDKPKGHSKGFPRAVVEINNPESLVLLRKVVIPVSMGTEEDVPPAIGKYFNVLLQYESNGHIYLYSSDGIPTAIEANIPQEVLDRIDQLEIDVDLLETGLANETTAREAADSALSSSIESLSSSLSAETAAREQADTTLQNNITAEATARANADTALNTAITSEVTARQEADINLQSQIDAITASSDVKDIVGTKAELNNYDTSTLGNNDIIKVLQDESENNATTYYRWNATTQQFTLIGEEGPYYTKSQADTLLNAKQNTLTAGSNVQIVNDTISATDTTYTAGSGLALNGTQFSVDTTAIATQSDLTAGLANKQDTLTAGTNIHITDESGSLVISADGTTYTAGEAIDITNSVISATNTGKAKVLTTADYNWPTTGTKTSVALWLLEPGVYTAAYNVQTLATTTANVTGSDLYIIGNSDGEGKKQILCGYQTTLQVFATAVSSGSGSGTRFLRRSDIVNNLTSTSTTETLSANQGKVLKDLIDAIPTPTTYTAGTGLDLTGTEFSVDFNDVQGKLTAGDNITIQDESGDLVISATGTTYTAGAGLNLVGTQFAVDTTTIATQTDLANKLDNSTTFWGQTANNGVVDGTINISSNSGLAGMSLGAGHLDIDRPASFYLRAKKNASTYSNVLWWNSASNNVPSDVHLDAAETKMTLLTNEVRLGGRYSSDNVKISNVATPQSAQDAATKGYVDTAVGAKQDVLTAGDNITIAEESGALVISATGGSSIDTFTTNEWNALWA